MDEFLISSAAEQELADALEWYAKQSSQAAEGFDREFDEVLRLIHADPERFPLCDDRHRFCLMRRYPFQIVYRKHLGNWVVIAVAHGKQMPGYWSNR